MNWRTIDWSAVHRTVRRLQAGIVKATQEGRWGKVQALQRLLTHLFSGKALAVRRVTENQGNMLHKWLKAGYIDQRVFHQTEEGTPQGGPITPPISINLRKGRVKETTPEVIDERTEIEVYHHQEECHE